MDSVCALGIEQTGGDAGGLRTALGPSADGSGAWVDWGEFEVWLLKRHSKNTLDLLLKYAKRFPSVLEQPSFAGEICALGKDKRRNGTVALVNLSISLGCYDRWKSIVSNSGLTWGKRSGLEAVISILNTDLSDLLPWLSQAVSTLPKAHRSIVVFSPCFPAEPFLQKLISCYNQL